MNTEVASTVMVLPSTTNSTDWPLLLMDAIVDDDTVIGALPLDGSEGGLFTGNFVPPPPRPLFLDDTITPDGLTTCDLCSWAWQNGNAYTIDASLEATAELGWVFTLVIVSLVSALLGAIVMIIALHCKRLKNTGGNGQRLPQNRPPISTPDDKAPAPPNNYPPSHGGVWSWLSRRSAPTPLDQPPVAFVENHYTHMEDGYNSVVGDALYAELDVDPTSPAYQNSAYTDPDAPTSSAPSSAYYSDLSVTTLPGDRAYEVVGLVTMPTWDADVRKSATNRLAAISETVPSDYV